MLNILFSVAFLLLAAKGEAFTIVCLGDSLTEGTGVRREQAWPALIEKEFKSKGRDIKIINSGISGATTASGPSRMKWHIKNLQKNPIDMVILALGANDALRGLDVKAARQNLEQTIDLALAENIKVVLVGMKAPPNLGAEYTKKFEAIFVDLAKKKKLILVDFLLDGVAGHSKLNMPDGIHPNAEGHVIIAKNVMSYLERFLL